MSMSLEKAVSIYDRSTYYHNPMPRWSAKTCARMARRCATDGLGTPYPFQGAVPELPPTCVRYNGGCIRGGKWYPGETTPLPRLAKGYKWIYPPTWCWQIVKET